MKKKQFNPTMIFGLIAGFGVLGTAIVKSATYITLPERVASAEEKVETIEDYIKEQRMANELMQKIVTNDERDVFSPDGKFRWDEEKQKWVPKGAR